MCCRQHGFPFVEDALRIWDASICRLHVEWNVARAFSGYKNALCNIVLLFPDEIIPDEVDCDFGRTPMKIHPENCFTFIRDYLCQFPKLRNACRFFCWPPLECQHVVNAWEASTYRLTWQAHSIIVKIDCKRCGGVQLSARTPGTNIDWWWGCDERSVFQMVEEKGGMLSGALGNWVTPWIDIYIGFPGACIVLPLPSS